MKHFILVPDSFKGTLEAARVCQIQEAVIRRHIPDAQVRSIPMADGGEGMVEAYLAAVGGQRRTATVTAPLGGTVDATYGLLPDGSAVIEMAAAAGLPLVSGRENPLDATTRGVGELILEAVRAGAKTILLGLGGSCTNDCGVGMAAALGYRFLDKDGQEVPPLARNLSRMETIVPPRLLPEVIIRAACDVDNPLTGPQGATYTFGAQKGADKAVRYQLEAGMVHFEQVLRRFSGVSAATMPGAGAAGGLGAAVALLLRGELLPGADLLLDSVGFEGLLAEADMVFTGEGRIDWQSARGKVPGSVAKRCKRAGVPCIALCGSIGKGAERLYEQGVTAIFSAVKGVSTFEEVAQTSEEDMAFLTDSVLRLLTAQKQ